MRQGVNNLSKEGRALSIKEHQRGTIYSHIAKPSSHCSQLLKRGLSSRTSPPIPLQKFFFRNICFSTRPIHFRFTLGYMYYNLSSLSTYLGFVPAIICHNKIELFSRSLLTHYKQIHFATGSLRPLAERIHESISQLLGRVNTRFRPSAGVDGISPVSRWQREW